jgi:hypothetical protein
MPDLGTIEKASHSHFDDFGRGKWLGNGLVILAQALEVEGDRLLHPRSRLPQCRISVRLLR